MTLDAREVAHYAAYLRQARIVGGASAALLVGAYVDCMRVFSEGSRGDEYEMPSLGGSLAALESVAIAISLTHQSRLVWLFLPDVDKWLLKDPHRVTLALRMFLKYQQDNRFPFVATADTVTPDLFGLFQTHIHLDPLSGAGRTAAGRRFATREAFDAEEETFDGLMELPSFRRRR